ncbi:hypothetical protein [Rugosimonospora africana]|uniref:Uncharacterized protein n=1 Tax=Rugosimonospora africana TaxID=556532 RepID=A0A8J3QT76_9ACTN|nr:hypothetical protein [Rugosimonospora africana]GIH16034.1 hypothetical protein Raf01_42060 [Rugosimonospora africana]
MTSPHRRDREQLIGVLVPASLSDRPGPCPAPMPALPVPRPPSDLSEDEVLIGVAGPDRSGRVTERALLRALGWSLGHRIGIHAHGEMLVIGSAVAGSMRRPGA